MKKMNWARWVARVVSSLTTILYGWLLIGNLILNYTDKGKAFISDSGELAITIFFIIVLAGTIIGWWNEKWGGVVLIVGYLANAIGGYILAVSAHQAAGFFVGFMPVILYLPYLVSGILYVDFWKRNRTSIKASG